MPRAKSLLGLACAAWACLCAPVLRADEQSDAVKAGTRASPAQPPPPYDSRLTNAPAPERNAPSSPSGEMRQAPPRPGPDASAQDSESLGDDHPPYQARSLYGAFDGGTGERDNAAFRSVPAWLQTHAVAWYGGTGLDYVVAQYPASTDSNVAWQFFGGVRTRYVGAELDFHTLGYYRAVVNNQTVELGTDMTSLSLMGFLPLAEDTDFYARYGRTAWSVNANGAGGGTASPVTYGTTGTGAAGIELRHGALLLRVEARRVWHVYQSDAYVSFGISVGGYIH